MTTSKRQIIEKIIKRAEEPLTTAEIRLKAKVNVMTAARWISVLEHEKLINIRKRGNVKLISWKRTGLSKAECENQQGGARALMDDQCGVINEYHNLLDTVKEFSERYSDYLKRTRQVYSDSLGEEQEMAHKAILVILKAYNIEDADTYKSNDEEEVHWWVFDLLLNKTAKEIHDDLKWYEGEVSKKKKVLREIADEPRKNTKKVK